MLRKEKYNLQNKSQSSELSRQTNKFNCLLFRLKDCAIFSSSKTGSLKLYIENLSSYKFSMEALKKISHLLEIFMHLNLKKFQLDIQYIRFD